MVLTTSTDSMPADFTATVTTDAVYHLDVALKLATEILKTAHWTIMIRVIALAVPIITLGLGIWADVKRRKETKEKTGTFEAREGQRMKSMEKASEQEKQVKNELVNDGALVTEGKLKIKTEVLSSWSKGRLSRLWGGGGGKWGSCRTDWTPRAPGGSSP